MNDAYTAGHLKDMICKAKLGADLERPSRVNKGMTKRVALEILERALQSRANDAAMDGMYDHLIVRNVLRETRL